MTTKKKDHQKALRSKCLLCNLNLSLHSYHLPSVTITILNKIEGEKMMKFKQEVLLVSTQIKQTRVKHLMTKILTSKELQESNMSIRCSMEFAQ